MVTSVDTEVMKALADPLRMQILRLLAVESLCVCHLVEETGAKQTNLSNHLRLLRQTGLVETESCGRFLYYKLKPAAVAALAEDLAALADQARATHDADTKRPCP
ncbi:ArsR/SmtB family transcription factor [Streptacidiphilus sp. N1-12]|uniref:ArsR/SmtB family transcription factor n=2 Tax=Streptacidiphilus alkalitolerans TaxID=3342712 RepID=A0ABV6WE80_9ACTN